MIDRIAAAPISWGVCEVPGWGRELAVDRVLSEMSELGFTVTEYGSEGYLPSDPIELRDRLAVHNLGLLGGFVPQFLHLPEQVDATLAAAETVADRFARAGGTYFITAIVTDWEWGPRTELSAGEWQHIFTMLDRLDELCARHGLTQALHPHLGTVIEQADEVQRVLDHSGVGWTFDSGHLALGGYDPLDFIASAGDRIVHAHLKDVVFAVADRVTGLAPELSLMEGVQQGMFSPFDAGDIAIDDIVIALEASGFDGWYVVEQDAAITGGDPAPGEGPILDVRRSVDYLRAVDQRIASPDTGVA